MQPEGAPKTVEDLEVSGQALEAHYDRVAKNIALGRVIPFLGAGANLGGRIPQAGHGWNAHTGGLPSGSELAEYLAARFGYPEEDTKDLARVAQFASVMDGSGPLYEELRSVFDADYEPTSVHRFLAGVPGVLHSKGIDRGYQLIVTTNFDDVLERAFRDAGEPFDLVCYMADGRYQGKFVHWPPDGDPIPIDVPNEYEGVSLNDRTAILGLHGLTDRVSSDWDSYVITEDHYIDYLTHTEVSNLIPVKLAAKLKQSHLLFLGYGLRDWNLRVILHRIWGTQKLNYKSWAVQLKPHAIEKESWRNRDVDILDVPLETYVHELSERLRDGETVVAPP